MGTGIINGGYKMTKINHYGKILSIECSTTMCENCSYAPVIPEQKCRLFNVLLDHVIGGSINNSGMKHDIECIKAEENTQ